MNNYYINYGRGGVHMTKEQKLKYFEKCKINVFEMYPHFKRVYNSLNFINTTLIVLPQGMLYNESETEFVNLEIEIENVETSYELYKLILTNVLAQDGYINMTIKEKDKTTLYVQIPV